MEYWNDKDRRYALKKRYGISLEDYDEFLKIQNGLCFICRRNPSDSSDVKTHKLLHVDHDHQNGKIRGLLCNGCNRALGFLGDNPLAALRAWWYLEFFKRLHNDESWRDMIDIGELTDLVALAGTE